jgi:tetratricopeptide (TPR) repeat protein
MADEFYRQARDVYENEQYVEAYAKCTKALKASPGHRGCLEINSLLAEKAKRLYEDGYILEELNPTQAIKKWKMVLEICPPENEYYQKAKSRIAKYE